ncbi:MAG: DUF819 family protein [Acidobacteriota bacterium]|nr:DUF819 family protein [Acidobacteriota bacterium]
MIDQPIDLIMLISVLTAGAFLLEKKTRTGRKLGASLIVLFLGMLVSNLGLVPLASPVYDGIFGTVTSLAIAWLLLAVDWNDLRAAGPGMIIAFLVAILGTASGAVIAFWLFDLGDFTAALAGTLTGSYCGGSLNFVSVGRALELPDGVFTAATAADNAVTAIWFAVTLVLPTWLFKRFKRVRVDEPAHSVTPKAKPATPFSEAPFIVTDIAVLTALGFGLIAASNLVDQLYSATAAAQVLPIPGVVWLTTLSLVTGTAPFVRRLHGALPLGVLALHVFFVVIGIGARFSEIMKHGLNILFFTMTIVAIHGLVMFLFGLVRKSDWDLLAVASQAAIGGPSTAMALAVSRQREHLALPGIAVGLLGYAVGTYVGLTVAMLLGASLP